jgi:hypothetical protein
MKHISKLGPTNNRHHYTKFSCLDDLTPAICTALLFTSSETSSNSTHTGTKEQQQFYTFQIKVFFLA